MLKIVSAAVIFANKKTSRFFRQHLQSNCASKLVAQWSDLAREPHARCLQQQTSILFRVPSKAISTSTDSVDITIAASFVPESTAVVHCAVVVVVAIDPRVVVAVISGEHHPVVVSESIASIAVQVLRYAKLVVAWLVVYNERAVLGVVPAAKPLACRSNLSL